MSDQPSSPPNDRFKAEMPHIPGVSTPGSNPRAKRPSWLVAAGLVAILIVALLAAVKFLSKPRSANTPVPAAPQIEVPAPVPDLTASVPTASEQDPSIANVGDLAKTWSSRQFSFRDRITGEYVRALVIRLPGGSPSQASSYWSIAMKPAYGNCQLNYVEDLQELKIDYGYSQAKHPMVGNPCTRSLYDPLKYAPLPGNILARGAVVQGSDLRPPLSIEIKLKGKQILAMRME